MAINFGLLSPGGQQQQQQPQYGINFNQFQPIQGPRAIAQLPEEQSSGGGIGAILKGLAGIAGAVSGGGSAVSAPSNASSGAAKAPIMANTSSNSMSGRSTQMGLMGSAGPNTAIRPNSPIQFKNQDYNTLFKTPAFQNGLDIHQKAFDMGMTKSPITTITDYSMPPDQPRQFTVDTQNKQILNAQPTGPMKPNRPALDINSATQAFGVGGGKLLGLDAGGNIWGAFNTQGQVAPKLGGISPDGSIVSAYVPTPQSAQQFTQNLDPNSQKAYHNTVLSNMEQNKPIQGQKNPALNGLSSTLGPKQPSQQAPALDQLQPSPAVTKFQMPEGSGAKYEELGTGMQEVLPKVIEDLRAKGYDPIVVEGKRTEAQQREKIAQGYSKTMNSNHLQGNAVDIVDRRYMWDDKKYGKELDQYANDIKEVADKYGLGSGRDWTKSYGPRGDFAHVEYKPQTSIGAQRPIGMAQNNNQLQNVTGLDQLRATPNIPQAPQSMTQQSDNPLAIPNVVKAAQTVYADNPVLGTVAAAQAILESNLSGKPSGLARQNNLFGIKGKGTAGSSEMMTKEQGADGLYSTKAGFAKNATLEDSYLQHKALMDKPRYKAVREATTVEEAIDALGKSGYATDKNYAKKLKAIYNQYLK